MLRRLPCRAGGGLGHGVRRMTAAPSLEAAHRDISEKGYTVSRLGAAASVRDMEKVALQLMHVDPSTVGSYNGRGGVVRSSIDGTGFVDSAAGAPKELTIQFHNEMAYATEYPKYVTFAMVRQADTDGTTTLADNVVVQGRLSTGLLDKFRRLGVQYVRYLHDEAERDAPDFYNSWQGAFQVKSLEEAMQKGNNRATFSILEAHSDGRRLRHTLWCPVFHHHPVHGELFFNSLLNRHGSWLDGHAVFGIQAAAPACLLRSQATEESCRTANGLITASGAMARSFLKRSLRRFARLTVTAQSTSGWMPVMSSCSTTSE
eukprot:s356_g4.t1